MSKPIRAVFMGTPSFAATILSSLLVCEEVVIPAVYTQPDRPAGRGKLLKESEVKVVAKQQGIPVFQPMNFKEQKDVEELSAHRPDVLIVAAYGLILPKSVLSLPSYMPINVHASLLPKYRGAAPIQRAIMDGVPLTGITIMHMQEGLDTGPILLQKATGIDINDTYGQLYNELALVGSELLLDALRRLKTGALMSLPQDNALSTYAEKLTKHDGFIDFTMNAAQIHATIRGVTPQPGAAFQLNRLGKEPLCIHCEPGLFPFRENIPDDKNCKPGDIGGLHQGALVVRCSDGWYAFTKLRAAGKKAIDAAAFYNGYLVGHEGSYMSKIHK